MSNLKSLVSTCAWFDKGLITKKYQVGCNESFEHSVWAWWNDLPTYGIQSLNEVLLIVGWKYVILLQLFEENL